jgi:hypothetical protein
MAAEWYYKELGKEIGPLTVSELRRLAKQCDMGPETIVRKGTHGQWVPACKVKGLLAGMPAQPTAITPPPAARSMPPFLSRMPEDELEM